MGVSYYSKISGNSIIAELGMILPTGIDVMDHAIPDPTIKEFLVFPHNTNDPPILRWFLRLSLIDHNIPNLKMR